MALTIVATPGSATANSYCTVAEATAYNDAHVSGSTWSDADPEDQKRALMTATRQLDAYLSWSGVASTDAQALAWPRTGMIDPITEDVIGEDAIPQRLKNATAEQARLLLVRDRSAESDTDVQGIASITAGSVQIGFRSPPSGSSTSAPPVLAPSAVAFVQPWVLANTSSQRALLNTVPLARV